jgi:hypothetical protein
MTVTKQDVMYALLALDAYNRHEVEDKRKMSEGANAISTQIGSATWNKSSDGIENEQGATLDGSQAAGFSASAYTYDGVDVIAYRGTDFPTSLRKGDASLCSLQNPAPLIDIVNRTIPMPAA